MLKIGSLVLFSLAGNKKYIIFLYHNNKKHLSPPPSARHRSAGEGTVAERGRGGG